MQSGIMSSILGMTVFCLLMVGGQASAGKKAGYDIGSNVLLFCDDQQIEKIEGVQLKMHSPEVKEVVYEFDAPWENSTGGYCTIIKDGDQYRKYYSAGGEIIREYTCVAFSKDGINWTRPNLGLFEYNGSKDNNIIWTGENKAYCESHNFSPFIDINPSCKPEERYKAVTLRHMVLPGEKDSRRVLMAFVSADGINWKRMQEMPIITEGSFDSHNTAFWDAARNEYVCYLRIGREGKRSVSRSTSKDFINWTKPEMLEFGGTPLEHFYTNGIEPYFRNPNIYIGFPMRFIEPTVRDKVGYEQKQTDGLSDMVFMSSCDGINWNRQFMEAFVRPGLDQLNWGSAHGNQTPSWHIVQSGPAEMSIYWLEHYDAYSLWLPDEKKGGYRLEKLPVDPDNPIHSRIRRGVLRLDGIVSVNAPYKGGEFVTKPIIFNGKEMLLNLSTSAVGSVKVEIQDAAGEPIPGFTLDDSKEVWGDEIERKMDWKTGSDVSKLSGKPVRLRFVMKDMDLYSVRFR